MPTVSPGSIVSDTRSSAWTGGGPLGVRRRPSSAAFSVRPGSARTWNAREASSQDQLARPHTTTASSADSRRNSADAERDGQARGGQDVEDGRRRSARPGVEDVAHRR